MITYLPHNTTFLLIMLVACAGCSAPRFAEMSPTAEGKERRPPPGYEVRSQPEVLSPGDTIAVWFSEDPPMNQPVLAKIATDGAFHFSGGTYRVAGLTPAQAAATIHRQLIEGYIGGPIWRVSVMRVQPVQRNDAASELEFGAIHMIDRKNGWAENLSPVWSTNDWVSRDKAIWKTADGGQSWDQVLCASPANLWGNISAFFQNSKKAWVAVTAVESTNVTVFRTMDGGRTWTKDQVRHPGAVQDSSIWFCGAEDGWLMLIPDHGMNSSPGALYRTSDRGAHWRLVNSTAASHYIWEQAVEPEFAAPHPFLVCGGSIAFRNNAAGWVRGSLTTTTPRMLFMTRDGGLNWQLQELPPPISLQCGHIETILPPQFFRPNSREGILPALYRPTNSEASSFATVMYRAHDGGSRWQPTTPVKFSGITSFVTASKGWVWTPDPHNTGSTTPVEGTLYRTDDSGVSWRPAGTGKSLEQYLTHGEDVVQLDFVDGEYGWAIARGPHNLTKLLRTTDSGETWSVIQPRVALTHLSSSR